jgi:hypothetical protein
VAIFIGRTPGKPERALERMKRKVDSERGKELIGRRFATAEPVFGNLRHNKGQRTGPFHLARQAQGRGTVAALPPGA